MPSIASVLGNPIADIIKGAGDIIAKFVPDPQAKIDATMKLAQLQQSFNEKLVDADMEFAKAQAEVITTESKSESWLARNWRPILMLTFTFIIAWNYIISQVFSLKSLPIPEDMWELIKLGVGGYIFGRSAEKMVSSWSDAKQAQAQTTGGA